MISTPQVQFVPFRYIKPKALFPLVLLCTLFISFGFRNHDVATLKAVNQVDTARRFDDEHEIEVITARMLVVIDTTHTPDGNKVKFRAELRDVFKLIKYESGSKKLELQWLLSSKWGVYGAGIYHEGDSGYTKLDSFVVAFTQRLKNK